MASGVKIWFDGSARPNPGAIEVAAVVRGKTYPRGDLGTGTNNDAEWLALLHAMDVAQSLGERDVVLLGDAMLVIKQASGAWKCRGADLQQHLVAFQERATQFARVRLRHVARSHNLAGIALERIVEQKKMDAL
jgi:ribonuclease HI